MHIKMFLIIVALNTPLYWLITRSFFPSWEDFFEAMVAIVVPPEASALSGNYHEHRIGRFTLVMYLLICGSITAAEYHVVARFLFGIKHPWG